MAQDNNAICILRPPPFGASRSNQRAHQSHRRCMTHTLWMLALLLRIQACMLRRPDPIMKLCPQWIDRLIDIRRSSSWLLPWIRTYSFSQVVGKTKLFVVRLVTKPLRLRKHRHWLDSTIKLHFMNEDVRRHLVTLIDEHVRPIPPLSAALSELASHACPSSPMLLNCHLYGINCHCSFPPNLRPKIQKRQVQLMSYCKAWM